MAQKSSANSLQKSMVADSWPRPTIEVGDGRGQESAAVDSVSQLPHSLPDGVVPLSPQPESPTTPGCAPHEGIAGSSKVVDVNNPYHMHELHFLGVRGNPVVVILSLIVTWVVVLVAILQSDLFFSNAADAKRWITSTFTWFFIGAQNTWVFFIVYIWLNSPYYYLKLGPSDSKPDYDTVTWFIMMFGTAGTGTGLVYYGVGEAIFHLGYNRYSSRGYLTYDQISQEAMNLTYYHWGIHAW